MNKSQLIEHLKELTRTSMDDYEKASTAASAKGRFMEPEEVHRRSYYIGEASAYKDVISLLIANLED